MSESSLKSTFFPFTFSILLSKWHAMVIFKVRTDCASLHRRLTYFQGWLSWPVPHKTTIMFYGQKGWHNTLESVNHIFCHFWAMIDKDGDEFLRHIMTQRLNSIIQIPWLNHQARNFLPRGMTINAESYSQILLKLRHTIKHFQPVGALSSGVVSSASR